MAHKDPFSDLPPIQEEPVKELHPNAAALQSDNENVTKGTAPRNLTKSISKVVVPVAVAGIFAWLFFDTEQTRTKAPTPEAVVDPAKQTAQTTAIIDDLKENAIRAPRPQTDAPPIAATTAAAPVVPSVPLPSERSNPELDKLREEAERRAQEIRSSPLEAGTFKLTSDDSATASARRTGGFDIQAQRAAHNAAREDAARSQERLIDKAMAAQADPLGEVRQKDANVEFLTEKASESLRHEVVRHQPSASRFIVNQGTVIRAVLLTGVNSELPGTVKAQVTSDVYDSTYGRHVMIPKGSTMIGSYNSEVTIGQERLMMAMTRMIFPDGTWTSLGGAGASDGIGHAGMDADVNNHFWKIFGTSLVLGAASTFLPDRDNTLSSTSNAGGVTQGGSVFGMALNDTLRTILERNKNIGPTLTLSPGQEFTLLVAKDMVLRPYR